MRFFVDNIILNRKGDIILYYIIIEDYLLSFIIYEFLIFMEKLDWIVF